MAQTWAPRTVRSLAPPRGPRTPQQAAARGNLVGAPTRARRCVAAASPRRNVPTAEMGGMEPRDGFLFEPLSFSTDGLEELQALYDHLPEDPYMPEGARYRLRRLSNVRGAGAQLEARRTDICQGANVNRLFPGVVRSFEPLEDAFVAHPAFRAMLAAFRAAARLHPDAPGGVDVHAIRTLARPGAAGEPAPEGIHRDGRRLVGIFVVGRRGIEGGATELYASCDAKGEREPLYRHVLQPGQGVLLNDREGVGVLHYTAAVRAAAGGGARDVVVMLV